MFNEIKRGIFGNLEQKGVRAAFGTMNKEKLLYIVYMQGGDMALLVVMKAVCDNIVEVMAKLKQINRENVEVWGLPPMSMQDYYKNKHMIVGGFAASMNNYHKQITFRELECLGKDFNAISSWFKAHVKHFSINKFIMIH